MESEEPGQGASADNISDADSEQSETPQRTSVDEPMPEASLTSKTVRVSEEGEEQNMSEIKQREGYR